MKMSGTSQTLPAGYAGRPNFFRIRSNIKLRLLGANLNIRKHSFCSGQIHENTSAIKTAI
jgi:hypothetical protein